MSEGHIVIIGAGVIGLQTAISLLEASYAVTIVAKHVPGDLDLEYTSPWAGAIWRSNALPSEHEQQAWDQESYDSWLHTSQTAKGDAEVAGILHVPMRLLWTEPHPYIPNGPKSIWYADHVKNFKELESPNITDPFICGATHDGIAVNAPSYLKYLARKVESLHGRIIRTTLPTQQGLPGALLAAQLAIERNNLTTPISAFINATGLGARSLVPDSAVYPIRGQTVVVKGEAKNITTMFYSDANASIAPRLGSNTSILGSTYELDNWNSAPDPAVTEKILQRCTPWAPELLQQDGTFEVIGVNVGFRPGRHGGARVEVEIVEVGEDGCKKEVVVCHNYGHGGSGFQNSFGSARKVVELIKVHLGQ